MNKLDELLDELFKIRETCSGGAKQFAAVFATKLFPQIIANKEPCWCFDDTPIASRNKDFYPKYTITYQIDSGSSIGDGGFYKLFFANNGKFSAAVFATFELAYAGLYKHHKKLSLTQNTQPNE